VTQASGKIAIFSYIGAWRAWLVPFLIGATAAALELGGQPLRLVLRYEHAPVAEGELWRLITGHLVHLGPSHMLMNVAALAVLAYAFGRLLKPVDWVGSGLAAALAIDLGLFVLRPSVDWYVGLSGVLHGFWAAATIHAWRINRAFAASLAGLLLVKLLFERLIGAVPLTGAIAAGPVVTEAHAFGAVGGACAALLTLAIRSRHRSL